MITRARVLLACVVLLGFAPAAWAAGQLVIPTQAHETLDFQLQSLSNNITLYFGEPQQLLLLKYRPDRLRPRVDYVSQSQAVLRMRDLCLVQYEDSRTGQSPAEPPKKEANESQTWEVRLCPAGPTKFALECDHGENTFDFSDFQVKRVDIQAAGATLDVGFSSQNSIECEVFAANLPQATLTFKNVLNARVKEMALIVPEATCSLELTGKPFEGESAISFHGAPTLLLLTVSKKIGLRVTAPADIGARFAGPQMTQSGEEWVTAGYENAKCRVRLVFAEDVPKLTVRWR